MEGSVEEEKDDISRKRSLNGGEHSSTAQQEDAAGDEGQQGENKKMKRDVKKIGAAGGDSAYARAYRGFSFEPIPSSGRPGTPHCYFAESYRVRRLGAEDDDYGNETKKDLHRHDDCPVAVVHRHLNGLAVVTAGNSDGGGDGGELASAEFLVKQAPAQSQGEKRKKQAKMMRSGGKGKEIEHSVRPGDDLAVLRYSTAAPGGDGGKEPQALQQQQQQQQHQERRVPCCVWGTALELNARMVKDPGLVDRDSLLEGYLAVILPTGPFPPPENTTASSATAKTPSNSNACEEALNAQDIKTFLSSLKG